MLRFLNLAAAALLFLHGLVHLLGTAVYLRLAELPEFPYKTTLLNGYWDLGPAGIRIFGILWAGAAIGLWVGALAFLLDWPNWRVLLVGVTLFSVVLTALDWTVAYAGLIVNVGILAALFLAPRL
ncbi:ABC transporter permease [Salinibacter sp. 10B]|uniref:ABC transporter permease n=1 Tax=Salinibacter sp. 10B TaxID=1923971 RepID=UPI000CF39A15|nr:ABC transporter permease [Salinibacter sp. 10B]PQJ26820.1 ABC transporter permease [Salinibacter sp. 10B]